MPMFLYGTINAKNVVIVPYNKLLQLRLQLWGCTNAAFQATSKSESFKLTNVWNQSVLTPHNGADSN